MTKQQQERKWWGGNNARKANFAVIGKRERKEAELQEKSDRKWRP